MSHFIAAVVYLVLLSTNFFFGCYCLIGLFRFFLKIVFFTWLISWCSYCGSKMHCLQLKKKKKYPHIVLDIAFLQLIDLVQSCQNRPLNFYYAFGRVGFSINLCDYVDVLQCLWQHHLYSHILPIDILNNILHICALLMNACLHHCDCRIFSYIPCTEENQAPTSENNSCFDFSLLRKGLQKKKVTLARVASWSHYWELWLVAAPRGRNIQRRKHPQEGTHFK